MQFLNQRSARAASRVIAPRRSFVESQSLTRHHQGMLQPWLLTASSVEKRTQLHDLVGREKTAQLRGLFFVVLGRRVTRSQTTELASGETFPIFPPACSSPAKATTALATRDSDPLEEVCTTPNSSLNVQKTGSDSSTRMAVQWSLEARARKRLQPSNVMQKLKPYAIPIFSSSVEKEKHSFMASSA